MESSTAAPAKRRTLNASTMAEAFRMTAEDYGDRCAVRTKDDSVALTWAELRDRADALAAGLAAMAPDGRVEPGFPMDSAWHGALPPQTGFGHLDDVPARVVLDLAEQGGALAKEHSSAHGPPVSLLDQNVMSVSAGEDSVGIPMRCVFALTAMGFLPQTLAEDEIVRVRAHPMWLRIDARFGSVYRRRGTPAVVLR